ncbi:type I-C CRISPR-associated protein Cas8c/Csd1 [Geoalkalibacter halelectricus]|uniref:Type I-C CRISPR-associated protein Cas8c/Csd1 n=1 Tax=Geoalkalibacter halelectricus TaxID=2847045 RepID=A0ABY5ZU53_9BACT|nr:type I-C CRISPR-associated protein Cas8c/Csd1 [Geoalkalibacter halelectricus]MDO3377604.1 type I-C CRISPR-associated protein Cas8c/Csd1 [Geoalkalibacter halelectricus]UWZ81395.1 type I-C CRISPR-associated protein Cas8c/Csd1 [Geoalkalibacter halelectricus]
MILQALNGYYERMAENPDSGMPPFGTSIESISFALVLDVNGVLQNVEDLREIENGKARARKLPVPAAVTRTSGVKSNFLWDKSSYVLGADAEGATEKNQERFAAFQDFLQHVGAEIDDPGFSAVVKFLRDWDRGRAEDVIGQFAPWEEVCNANLVFRLDGVPGFIHNRPPVQKAWARFNRDKESAALVQCLISGAKDAPLAPVHTPIKGVRGGQTSGGYIVSFNKPAFVSYAQDKASVSEDSAFAYTTALNGLLAGKSRRKVHIGDTTLVFWAQRASPAEEFLADLIEPSDAAVDTAGVEDDPHTAGKISSLLHAIRDGRRAADILPDLDESVQFYLLALAPNAARLSIRFWETNSLGSFLERIGRHFQQLDMVRQFDNEPEFPPLWRLLCQIAPLGKNENIPAVLAGAMAKAMLTGCRYPQNLLAAVLGRIRAEHVVTYFRAALLKAFLMRNHQMEVPVSLDIQKKDLPYLLGRLFAVLEKAQEEAVPGSNATIKDRYLASASATPGQVFHLLLKNAANHVSKLRKDPEKKGRAHHLEILTQDIMAEISAFPRTLPATEQGQFMIGYYHQRKDFFTKKNQEG